jgi:hypothetical protein
MKDIKLCTKEGCRFSRDESPMPMSNNFCPQCGSEAEVYEVEVEGYVKSDISPWKLNEETGERLTEFNSEYSEDGVHLFVPNIDWLRPFICERGVENNVGEIMRVRAATLEQEMSWLESHFKEDISKALEIYGENKVEIRWGVLGEFL